MTKTQSHAQSCGDIAVVDLHGSGEKAKTASPPGQQFFADLQTLVQSKNMILLKVPYDAAGGAPTLAGAALKFPVAYYQSVTTMKGWLYGTLSALAAKCAKTKVIVVGYSQGAQAAADIYQEKAWPNVIGLVLFGDPYFNASDKTVDQVNYKTGNNGSLGQRPHFANPSHVRSYCHAQDLVCQLSVANILRFVANKLKIPAHNSYNQLGEPEAAAKYFAAQIMASNSPKPASTPKPAATPKHVQSLSFNYVTNRGYRYLIQIKFGTPQIQVTLGDPGKIMLAGNSLWATMTVSNQTGSRPAPLGTNLGDVLVFDAFVPFPKSLANDLIATEACNQQLGSPPYGNCWVPDYINVEAHGLLMSGATIPIGGSVTLAPPNQGSSGPSLDAFALGVPWDSHQMSEANRSRWIKVLTAQPVWYVVKVAPGGFGNDSTSNFDGYDDYSCQNGQLPIIAVFGSNGQELPLNSGGCKKAMDLMRGTS